MPVIRYEELTVYIDSLSPGNMSPVYLIYGEPFLYRTALRALLDRAFPGGDTTFNYEPLDGSVENVYRAVTRLKTFSLLSGLKITALCDSNIFYQKKDVAQIFENAEHAYQNDDVKKAATYLLNGLSVMGLCLDDLGQNRDKTGTKAMILELAGKPWVDHLYQYCMDQALSSPDNPAGAPFLDAAIQKGFPEKNHLVITTDIVDRRQRLFKTIANTGMVIDCSVPKGEKAADKRTRETVLNREIRKTLSKHQKFMDPKAVDAICSRVGFDLHTLMNHMEKLIGFVGDRDRITATDVSAVVERSKHDPIYELTNAIAEKNIENALLYTASLLASGYHPLQVLAAVSNQIRRLFAARIFLDTEHGAPFKDGCDFQTFKGDIIPRIQAYDSAMLEELDRWESRLTGQTESAQTRKPKKSAAAKTDLLVAKDPKNPYPIFKLLQSAATFSAESLLEAIDLLGKTDLQLKSSRLPHRLILENVIISICRETG